MARSKIWSGQRKRQRWRQRQHNQFHGMCRQHCVLGSFAARWILQRAREICPRRGDIVNVNKNGYHIPDILRTYDKHAQIFATIFAFSIFFFLPFSPLAVLHSIPLRCISHFISPQIHWSTCRCAHPLAGRPPIRVSLVMSGSHYLLRFNETNDGKSHTKWNEPAGKLMIRNCSERNGSLQNGIDFLSRRCMHGKLFKWHAVGFDVILLNRLLACGVLSPFSQRQIFRVVHYRLDSI